MKFDERELLINAISGAGFPSLEINITLVGNGTERRFGD